MPTNLKNLKITSTDLVNQGANPDAYIKLHKRKDDTSGNNQTDESIIQKILNLIKKSSVKKEAETFKDELDEKLLRKVTNEMWDFCYALENSLCSIICDGELDESKKQELLFTSLDEFAEVIRTAAPKWAAGELYDGSDSIKKSTAQNEAFAKFWESVAGGENPQDNNINNSDGSIEENTNNPNNFINEEETDTMKIDKSKMTAEEQAMLAEFEKKYGVAENILENGAETLKSFPLETTPELHPEVKKALDDNKTLTAEIEALKKSLEISSLTTIAKKYEIIGKKADELAPKLYELKKAGGTAYDDFVGLLDEQLTLVEKGGMFAEIGSGRSGSPGTGNELSIKAAEIKKGNNGMSTAEAIAKAFEENPELAALYEKEYMGGK